MIAPKITSNKGFTLMELLITIAVIGLGVSATLIALQQGIGTIDYAKSRLTAIFLAQEGIEVIQNIRDTNFLENHYSSPTDWNENLGTGIVGTTEDFQVQYSDPQSVNPSLIQPVCSPNCNATSSSLDFLKKQDKDFYNYSAGTLTKYKRKVNVTQIDSEQIEVKSTVYWRKRQGGFGQVDVVQKMYKWW